MPALRQTSEIFCNSSARASIPSRALISFSRVLMVLLLEVSFQSSQTEILPPESQSTHLPSLLQFSANCPLISN
jgi:hypothetical protein